MASLKSPLTKYYEKVVGESDDEDRGLLGSNEVYIALLSARIRTLTYLCVLFFGSTVLLLLVLIFRATVPTTLAASESPTGDAFASVLRHHAPYCEFLHCIA